jgi:FKBP-type peptidyl-prolyl cis-trans isomerase FklB
MNGKRILSLAIVPLLITACQKAPESDSQSEQAATDKAVLESDSQAEQPTANKAALESDKEIYSYGAGYQLGSQMASSPIELNADGLIAGINDALNKTGPRVPPERLQEVAQKVQAEMEVQQQAEAETSRKAAEAFLAENATKANIVALDSGLQYRIIESAEGEKPTAEDTVVINYRGTLTDGTAIDSSYDREEPLTIVVSNIIPGWQEALQLMPVGSKWELFIPPTLAYGAEGRGPIPPNAVLVFELELIEIQPSS